MIKIRTNLTGGILTMLLAGGLYILMPSQIKGELLAEGQIGAAFAPSVVLIVMFLLGICLIAQSTILKKEEIVEINKKQLLSVGIFSLIVLFAVVLFYLFGFLISTIVMCLLILINLKCKSWKIYLSCGILIAVVYITFTMVLKVQLP